MVRLMYGAGAAPPQIVVADDERGVRWPGGWPACQLTMSVAWCWPGGGPA
jgi:hypothetical protein